MTRVRRRDARHAARCGFFAHSLLCVRLPAAPCHQAPVTDRKACTCLYVDEAANVLWVADKEGFVSGARASPVSTQAGGLVALSFC